MKKYEPLVSIGLTAYQRPKELRRALESIISQTYQNLEIIVSENYSPGFEIKKIVQEFLKKDRRIKYFQHKPNKGACFNGKFVLGKATGKYFMWAADDDYWAPNCLAQLVYKLESSPEVGLVGCANKTFNNDATFQITRFNGRYNPNNKKYFGNFWTALHFPRSKFVYFSCGLYRRKLLQELHHQVTNIYALDRFFIIFFSLVAPINYIDKILYFRQVLVPPDKSNDVNLFTWQSEITGIIKIAKTIIISNRIVGYRKCYLPIAVFVLFFRLVMLAIIKIIGILFKATLFIPKKLEQLQIYIARRYS